MIRQGVRYSDHLNLTGIVFLSTLIWCKNWIFGQRGTSALHLNESTWIIDGSNELIVDFLFALVLFLDSTQPRPFKNPKQIFFFGSNKGMTCKSNSNAKPNPGQHHSSFHLLLHSNPGLVFLFSIALQLHQCDASDPSYATLSHFTKVVWWVLDCPRLLLAALDCPRVS